MNKMASSNSFNVETICESAMETINYIRLFETEFSMNNSPENREWLEIQCGKPSINIQNLKDQVAALELYYKISRS